MFTYQMQRMVPNLVSNRHPLVALCLKPTRLSGSCQLLCEVYFGGSFPELVPQALSSDRMLLVVLCKNNLAHMIGRMQLSA
jgi:hypothetical protein